MNDKEKAAECFLSECVTLDMESMAWSTAVYRRARLWGQMHGRKVAGSEILKKKLLAKGFEQIKVGGRFPLRYWAFMKLKKEKSIMDDAKA